MARAAPKRAGWLVEVVAVPAYATSTKPFFVTSGISRRYFPVDRVVAVPTESHVLIGAVAGGAAVGEHLLVAEADARRLVGQRADDQVALLLLAPQRQPRRS